LAAVAAVAAIIGGDAASLTKSDNLIPWPAGLPVYDHVVIVIEENKDYDQVVGKEYAPFINETLSKEGAAFTQMFAEEHRSQGNYFWLFSGSNHGVGFRDGVPDVKIRRAPNLGAALIHKGLSFKGYSEDLPEIGSEVLAASPTGKPGARAYARKHVPWISFDNVPNKDTVKTSSNLRFKDFPTDEAGFASLPTVAIVIPNLKNDMHDSEEGLQGEAAIEHSVGNGDAWLKENLGGYYQWAKTHNSLLIVTFDENDDQTGEIGLTDPFAQAASQSKRDLRVQKDRRNQICTVFAGVWIKHGEYPEGKGITHVNILRTLEAMYGLPRAGAQQPNAARGGIEDDYIVTDVFERAK
jgi:acid phosphatase